jgi:hypothetical protein
MLVVMMLLRIGLELTGQTILPVKKVQIYGNRFLSNREILSLLELNSGTSILFLNLDSAKERLKRDHRIRIVQMVKVYPDTVKIHVREKDTAAILVVNGSSFLISDDGVILDRASFNRPDVNRPDVNRPDVNRPDLDRPEHGYSEYPFISLLSKRDDIKIGNPVDNFLVLNLLGEAVHFEERHPEFSVRIDSYAVDNSGIWVLLQNPHYKVYLGNEVDAGKLNRLRALIHVLDQSRDYESGVDSIFSIDLSGVHAAVREGDDDELR